METMGYESAEELLERTKDYLCEESYGLSWDCFAGAFMGWIFC